MMQTVLKIHKFQKSGKTILIILKNEVNQKELTWDWASEKHNEEKKKTEIIENG